MKIPILFVCLVLGSVVWAQQNPPAKATPGSTQETPVPATQPPQGPQPDTKAPTKPNEAKPSTPAPGNPPADRSEAYYHYSLGHMYEELAGLTSRAEYINKAIDEYKLAMQADPDSTYLNAALAELYSKMGRIRDAVLEAQDIIKRDPNNVDARKLLGRIYLRSLGDLQSSTESDNILRLAIEQYEQIVRLEPDDVDNHLLLGRLYRTANQMGKAEAEFKTAVKLQPDSEDAISSLALLLNEEGDSASALQVLNAVPESSRTGKIYATMGFTYEQQKDYKHAVEAFRKAVDDDKDNLDFVRGLAQNLMNDGQLDEALKQYKLVSDADPQDAESLLRIAELYRRMGRYDDALAILKRTEALAQDSMQVPFNMALVYEAQGKWDDAAKIYQDLLDKTARPDNKYSPSDLDNRALFLDRLGNVYRDTARYDQAIDVFRKMVELGPEDNSARAYQELIDTYREAKNWPQATAVAREAVQKLPKNRDLKMVLASQLADMGQGDQAVQQVRTLLKGNAEDRDVYIALAQMESRQKHWKEAEDAIDQAEKLSTKPDDRETVLYVAGSIYERQKKYDRAEDSFKRVLADDPQNAGVLNYLGYMLADRGVRLDEALGYIKKAVQLDPQNGAYLDSLGWVYFKQGNYELAEFNLRRAVERLGNDATVQQHLGDLYQKTGRLRLATVHWQRALDEWNKSIPAEQDQEAMAKTQKKLEQARVRLAKQAKAENKEPD